VEEIIRFCGKKRCFIKIGNLWTDDEDERKRALLARALEAEIFRTSADGEKVYELSGNVASAKHMIEATLARLPRDDTFVDTIWDSVIGKICYRDGI
jgi:hypothetical protein